MTHTETGRAKTGRACRTRRSLGVAAIAVLVGAALLSGCATRPPRAHVQVGPAPAHADFDNYGRVLLPHGARILVIGDDLVGQPSDLPGAAFKRRKHPAKTAEPFTVRLKAALGPNVTLISETSHGQRLGEAVNRFPTLPRADAVIMVFGLGDAWGGPKPLPADQFANSLSRLITMAKDSGAPVIVVAPPPVSNPKNNGLLALYRGAAQARAQAVGESLLTLGPNFRDVHNVWSDGVHLGTAGSHALANFLAGYFIVPAGDGPSN
jgi:hypothetical protein